MLPVFVTALVICCATACGFEKIDLCDSFVLPNISVNLSRRSPYRNYDNMDEAERLNQKRLTTFAIMLGKRQAITSALRMQVSAGVESGSAAEDTAYHVLLNDDTERTVVRHARFTFLNLIPKLHILLPPNQQGNLFFSAGAGFHYLLLNERKADIENTINIIDNDLLEERSFSISANIGAGFERRLSEKSGIAIVYNLRFWKPVQYTQTADLFPMGAHYSEYLFTHSFGVSLLLPNPTKQ